MAAASFHELLLCLKAAHEALEARCEALSAENARLRDDFSKAELAPAQQLPPKRLAREPQHRALPPVVEEGGPGSEGVEVAWGRQKAVAGEAQDCSTEVLPGAKRIPDADLADAVAWTGARSVSLEANAAHMENGSNSKALSREVLLTAHRSGVFQVRGAWIATALLREKIRDKEARARVEEDLQAHLREAMQEMPWVMKSPSVPRPTAFADHLHLQLGGHEVSSSCGKLTEIILHPRGLPRMLWDCMCVCLVLYDFTIAPLQFMWTHEPGFLTALDWIVNVCWTADVALSFRTGFYFRGKLVMEPKAILLNYCRTWMAFDVVVVTAEWLALTSRLSIQVDQNRSMMQVIRMARLIRLVRVGKLPRLKRDLLGGASSVQLFIVTHVAAWVAYIMGIMHVLACSWYGLGDHAEGWAEIAQVRKASLVHRYFLSLHWAISQMHGFMEVHPVTLAERIFATVVAILCSVILALFVSSTTQVLEMHSYYGSEHHERAVRSYLQRHHVRVSTAINIQKVVRAQSRLKMQREKYSEVLKLLPVDLFKDLMLQVRGPALVNQSNFFAYFGDAFPRVFRQLCHEAIREEVAHDEDIIFDVGDACIAARCVADGQLRYELDPAYGDGDFSHLYAQADHHSPGKVHAVKVTRGFWISEGALWMPWKHVGKLRVLTDASMLLLPLDQFIHVVSLYQEAHYTVALYAQQFTMYVNDVGPNDIVDSLPPSVWEPEFQLAAMHRCASETPVPLPFQAELPAHLSAYVCTACVQLAQRIALRGLDEHRPHHGFTIIIGEAQALDSCGKAGFNPFKGHELNILDGHGRLDEEAFDILRRNAFNTDGAIVVDGLSSQVIAAGWFVTDISLGGTSGGARTRSARAVAQQAGGCYVIKCSEDSTKEVILLLQQQRVIFTGTLLGEQEDSSEDEPELHKANL